MLVDSHCHIDCIDLTDFDGGVEDVISNAHVNGVGHFLCVGLEFDTLAGVVNLAERFANVSFSVGVHPNVELEKAVTVDDLLARAGHEKCVAIGETGLDYYRTSSDAEWQRERFRVHIEAAKQCGKPLIIHTRSAAEDTLNIMQQESACDVGGVMHCFAEDWPVAERALAQGFYISFSGIVTFKSAKALQEVAQKVPLNRLLIETDSPYLAPTPFRGKQNQPAYVRYVAEKIAELRDMDTSEIATISTDNFFQLFSNAKR